MFVGYNTDLGDNVYRMWNPKTKRIYCTKYFILLKIIYYKVKIKKARKIGGNGIGFGEN